MRGLNGTRPNPIARVGKDKRGKISCRTLVTILGVLLAGSIVWNVIQLTAAGHGDRQVEQARLALATARDRELSYRKLQADAVQAKRWFSAATFLRVMAESARNHPDESEWANRYSEAFDATIAAALAAQELEQ